MPRQGRACYAALGLEPIPWATGSQFLVLCHQLHVNPVLAALHRTLWPVLGRPSTSALPTQGRVRRNVTEQGISS